MRPPKPKNNKQMEEAVTRDHYRHDVSPRTSKDEGRTATARECMERANVRRGLRSYGNNRRTHNTT